MTEISNPIVQAVRDAIEAAVAATATELAQAVGFVGPATADQVRDRVEQLKNTIRQYLHWTSAAIPVMHAACAVRDDPAQLPTLIAAVDRYQARPVQPEPLPPYTLRVPVPSPWLNAIDEAIAALDSGDDRYGEETLAPAPVSAGVAGLEYLRSRLTGEGAPEIDAVWPAWPDAAERMWASLLAQADAEPGLATRGDDDLPGAGVEAVGEPLAEIEMITGMAASDVNDPPQRVTLCDVDEPDRQRVALIYLSEFIEIVIPRPGGVIPGRMDPEHELAVVRVELLDGDVRLVHWDQETCAHGDGVIMSLVPACPANEINLTHEEAAADLSVLSLCDAGGHPLACLITPTDLLDDDLRRQLETQAAHYGQIVIEDQGTDRADTPAQALVWIAQTNHRLGLAPTRIALAP